MAQRKHKAITPSFIDFIFNKGKFMLRNTRNLLSFLQPTILIITTLAIPFFMWLSGNALSGIWSKGISTALLYWLSGATISFFVIRKIYPSYSHINSLITVLLFLFIGVGLLSSIACLFFILSTYAIGEALSSSALKNYYLDVKWENKLLLGLSVNIAIIGTLIHYTVNYRLTYVLLTALPIIYLLYKNSSVKNTVISQFQLCNRILSDVSYWKLCSCLMLFGFVASFAFIPSAMPDDNGYHLAMFSQLQFHHKFLFDVETQLWSAAPFTLDTIHGFLSVLAGEDARGALNICMLFFLSLSVIALSRLISKNVNFNVAAVTLFLSTPIIPNLLLGLQTEIVLALITTTSILIVCSKELDTKIKITLSFLASCILMSIKLPAGLIVLAICVCLIYIEGKNIFSITKIRGRELTFFSCLFLLGSYIAIHPYLNAYLITGNPTFPLYNAIFKSPFYDAINFKDTTFSHGASWTAYLGLFFNTSKYFESSNFIAGFQYFLLPLIGALYLIIFKPREHLLALILPIIIFGGTMFFLMQYWRYLFPILPLACVLAISFFIPAGALVSHTHYKGLSITTLAVYLFLNIHYIPAASWIFHTNHLACFSPKGKDQFLEKYNVEHSLNTYMNKNHPGENVLFELTRPFGATLWGKPYYFGWSSPASLKAFDRMNAPEDLIQFLKERNIQYLYWYEPPISNLPKNFFLRDYVQTVINRYGKKEKNIGDMSIYRLYF